MALPPGLANWHWRSKGVSGWAKQWFESELTTIITTEGNNTVGITSVRDVEGDVELGMRKSKLLTIFDCKIEMAWEGVNESGTTVSGKLTIPEVSHEITLDGEGDYVFDFSLTTSQGEAGVPKFYDWTRKVLPPLLKQKFSEFPTALLDTHGKDLKVEGTPATSGTATPAEPAKPTLPSSSTAAASGAATKPAQKTLVSTSSVTVEGNFMASAEDLYEFLTNESRIPAWSHAPAKSNPSDGGEFSLFGGNITGKFTELDKPKKIVQTWTLKSPNWPDNQPGTLTTTLDQSSDSTKVTFRLDGVPKGQEDELEANIKGYYIRGFQSIGLASVL